MKGLKTFYICSECEYKTSKWMGKCPNCNAWNSFVEDVEANEAPVASPKRISMIPQNEDNRAVGFHELKVPDYMRKRTGLSELDRVLGGGLVHGSVVLLSGEPGIGKSTLIAQVAGRIAEQTGPVLYVSGEESGEQVKLTPEEAAAHILRGLADADGPLILEK